MTDPNDWRDHEPGRTGVSVAQLGHKESVTAQTIDEPFRKETSQSDSALHVPVTFLGEIPEGFSDMSGDPIEADDEYNIINSSTAFFRALRNAFPDGSQVTGQHISITAYQEGDDFSRLYDVEAE